MPYASKAQQGYFHAHPDKVGAKVVKEFDAASKGQHGLPKYASKGKSKSKVKGAAHKSQLHSRVKAGLAKAFPPSKKGGY